MDPGLRRDGAFFYKKGTDRGLTCGILVGTLFCGIPALKAEPQHCVHSEVVLWVTGSTTTAPRSCLAARRRCDLGR